MAKRFTNSAKWHRKWLRSLSDKDKIFWFFINDDCDHAGVWDVDWDNAKYFTGHDYDYKTVINAFGDKLIETYDPNFWFVTTFPEFQYGIHLNTKNRTHLSVIEILKKYDLLQYTDLIIKDNR